MGYLDPSAIIEIEMPCKEVDLSETTICIKKRSGDYMAYLEKDKLPWGCGRTHEEAIDDVKSHHSEHITGTVTIKFEDQ